PEHESQMTRLLIPAFTEEKLLYHVMQLQPNARLFTWVRPNPERSCRLVQEIQAGHLLVHDKVCSVIAPAIEDREASEPSPMGRAFEFPWMNEERCHLRLINW
ncbi:MAG: hypothetical protein RLZZ326_663, partial [Planctomycetota bacterium]